MPEFTIKHSPQSLAEALSGRRLRTTYRLALSVGIGVLLLMGTALVYGSGGTRTAWPHVMYVPVVLAAWGFGPLGGIAAAMLAGVAVGPAMPLDVATGMAQEPANWLARLSFLTLIGGTAGTLNHLLRQQLGRLDEARHRFASMVHHAPDVILLCDGDGVLHYASPSTGAVLGRGLGDIVGDGMASLVHPDDHDALDEIIRSTDSAATRGWLPVRVELRLRHADGSWRHLEVAATNLLSDPAVAAVVLNARDVTERRAMEAQLQHQARHDRVTGLANDQRLTDELREALAAGAERDAVAVLVVSLDRFQSVEKVHGSDTVDQLMHALAQRLSARLRTQDLLARHRNSEFAILCRGLGHREAALEVAERVLHAVREPFLLVTGEVRLTASVGLATPHGDFQEPEQLLREAHMALRRAEQAGGNRWLAFEAGWSQQPTVALDTDPALHDALERGEFELHYQPIVQTPSGQLTGFEALIRWRHPQLGMVPPSDFIPIAEQTGAIVAIGRWVVQQACRQLATWRATLHPTLTVAVNLSARQLDDSRLLQDLEDALAAAGLPGDALTVELTESSLVIDPDGTAELFTAIRRLGVRVAIDDFGTGYSALGYLQRLPVDILKVDRSFVAGLGAGAGSDAIVSAVIGLAHTLGLSTVAEGVESLEQRDRLVMLGCDHSQGYLHAPPAPADAIPQLLTAARLKSGLDDAACDDAAGRASIGAR